LSFGVLQSRFNIAGVHSPKSSVLVGKLVKGPAVNFAFAMAFSDEKSALQRVVICRPRVREWIAKLQSCHLESSRALRAARKAIEDISSGSRTILDCSRSKHLANGSSAARKSAVSTV
jgi:hypothetical protein